MAIALGVATTYPVAVLKAQTDPSPNVSSHLANDLVQQGRVWFSHGRHEEALKAFETALQADPASRAALLGKGESLVKLQRYDDAVRALDEYLKKAGPATADVYHLRGLVQAKLGKYSQAIADYTQALTIRQDTGTYTQRGWAYLANSAPKQALADFEEAIRLDRKNGDAYNGRGLARLNFGQYRSAVLDAEEAVRRSSATPRQLLNAARIYAQASGRLQAEAIRDKRLRPPECYQYRDRSVLLLRKTLDTVPAAERAAFWRAHLQTNVAFDPVRTSPDFVKLEAEVHQSAKPKEAPP